MFYSSVELFLSTTYPHSWNFVQVCKRDWLLYLSCPDIEGVLHSPTKCIYVFRCVGVTRNKERLYPFTVFTD